MNAELMTWVAGISIAGVLYLLYKLWIMSHAVNTMWNTFKSETERMESDRVIENALIDTMIGSFIESVERLDERLSIVEKQLGETID